MEIYGLFIHRYDGSMAFGMFEKEYAKDLEKILIEAFGGMDEDDMVGAFGPLDSSNELIVFDDGTETGEFNIYTTNDKSKITPERSFKTKFFLRNMNKFWDIDKRKFKGFYELFDEWYDEDQVVKLPGLDWEKI